jgi:chromosome partitioning protein
MILTLQNQKGGVGKTTLSLNLAHQFTYTGMRVLVVDADPQGSARDWLAAREDPAPFTVIGLDRPTIHRDITDMLKDYDAVVIDSPPRVTDIARSAILASDLVVIPMQPSPLDVWAAQDTISLINDARVYKETLKSVFAINREIVNTAIGRDVTEALAQSGTLALRSHISQRVVFAESMAKGQTVFEMKSDRKAISEIEALGREIVEHSLATVSDDVRRLA